jgi:hypothetical protein
MAQNNLLPLLPDGVRDVELPVDSLQESHLVGVDLAHLQTRDLAPCPSRVVAVLQILGGENQSSKKHTTATLESTVRCIFRLSSGEVLLGQVRLDEDQVVQGNLQGGVASARSTESLLDKGTQRKDSTTRTSLTAALRLSELPDDLDHLSCRIDEAIDKVDFSFALPYELGRAPLADGGA